MHPGPTSPKKIENRNGTHFTLSLQASFSGACCIQQKELHGQEIPNSVGSRKSMYQIQATVAMEQYQVRLGTIAIAAGPSIQSYIKHVTRSSFETCPEEHPRRAFIQAPMQSIFKVLQDLYATDLFRRISKRISTISSPRGFHQDLLNSFSQGPAQDHVKASHSISRLDRDLHARTPKALREALKIV